jgi:uncharacterized protein (DUF362 family)/Pyruvate/2-oxoacid:ferredoxin oxidoreductase delta subunit
MQFNTSLNGHEKRSVLAEQIAISRCADYEQERVDEALRRGIDLLGGIGAFVSPGQKVVLKVNLLAPTGPERAVTTHPAVVEAMVRLVQEAGGEPVIADSPGASVPYTPASLRLVYRITGMLEVAERTGAALNWDTAVVDVAYLEGVLIKRLEVIKPVFEADVVISMPKLKTHVLTCFTGATKNLFGVIPGLSKPGYHAKLHTLHNFSAMLLDVTSFVNPALVVMDGIVGMEGKGPRGGNPRRVGVLLLGRDSVALDAVATTVVGINPLEVETLKIAREWGRWSGDLSEIEVLGASIEEVRIADFVKPPPNLHGQVPFPNSIVYGFIAPLLRRHLTLWPEMVADRCTACQTCLRSCPVQAISIKNGLAVVDYDKCIRCYCCHELCPEGAVELRRSWLGRLIYRGR